MHDRILEGGQSHDLFLHNSISQVMHVWECETLIPPLNIETIQAGTKKNCFQFLEQRTENKQMTTTVTVPRIEQLKGPLE